MDSESSQKEVYRIEKFDEPLEQPGKIFLAEIHGSAQRLLKVKKLSKYIRFCQCCLLPSETPGVVMPYTCLDNRKDFGLGIHLYFHYILFCLIITFVSFCLSSIPTMVFSIRYSNHLRDHCRMYYHNSNITVNNSIYMFNPQFITNNSNCIKYLSENNDVARSDLSSIIQTDWVLKMSTDNLKNYFSIFNAKSDIINSVLLNFSFLYFLTSITLLIINFFYIHYVNTLTDKEDYEETSPRDYTILVHGVERVKDSKEITRKENLRNMLNEISNNYFRLDIHDIIPCYNLVQLYKLSKKVFEDRVKIYHAHNFKKQKDLHEKYLQMNAKKIGPTHYQVPLKGFDDPNKRVNSTFKLTESSFYNLNKNNNFEDNKSVQEIYHENNLNYYKKFFCYINATPLKKIEERMNKNKEKIKEIEKDLYANPDKYNCGTYFVVFKYISMRDQIYSFFPTNFSSKVFLRIKYFFQNIICGACTSEKTKRTNYLRKAFTIEHATEAYEVLWQNLGYTLKERYFYLLLSVVVTIVLMGVSLCIVIGLNEAQYKISKNGANKNFLRYFLSFLISISIAIINSLGRKVLKIITKNFEAIETRTDYYISLSIKISIFTFINTAIIPLLSNYMRGEWGNNDILINNILMIFITNITLTPFTFFFSVPLCVKISRRAKARLDLEGVPTADSKYTQGQLNKIFENPNMELSYKYSYLTNTLLTSLFYMSIFPLGTVFCIVALVLCYYFEIFYLGFYKRPELLNSRLCKFFIQNFKIVISVFCIGNYVFLSSINEHYRKNWSLINLILFIIIAFIPYHSARINFLGTTEGEASKGSYEDYALMFPTDYEKENPLTKKRGMIKHFNKLREMNLIDKYQCEYLIKNLQKENTMDNYYKTSRNVGKILSSYEFQRQFVKLKRKYKFIKEVRRKQSILNKYDINLEDEFRKRGLSTHSRFSQHKTKSGRRKSTLVSNINNNDDESNLGVNKNNEVNMLADIGKINNRRRTSTYMRQTLFKRIKDEGIYSESEEESESDSDITDSLEGTSRKNTIFDFDANSSKKDGHSSKKDGKSEKSEKNEENNGLKYISNFNAEKKIDRKENPTMNTIKEVEDNEDISSSVDTQYREYVKKLKQNNILNQNPNINNNNIQIVSLKDGTNISNLNGNIPSIPIKNN